MANKRIYDLDANADQSGMYIAADKSGLDEAEKVALSDLPVGDIVADLANSETAITTTESLTSTAFGVMHTIAGTSSDYTVTLPAASGNGGKIIGLRVLDTATKLFTIDGNASETIDGHATIKMVAGDAVILLCDGSNWAAITSKRKPITLKVTLSTDQTGVVDSTFTKIEFDTIDVDDSGDYDNTTNYRYTPSQPGMYFAVLFVAMVLNDTDRLIAEIRLNGTGIVRGDLRTSGNTALMQAQAENLFELNGSTDYLEFYVFHAYGANRDVNSDSVYTFAQVFRVG